MENIKKLNYENKEHYNIKIGKDLLIKANVHKIGKRIISNKIKFKQRINKIPAIMVNYYGGGLFVVAIDILDFEF